MSSRPPCTPVGCGVILSLPILGISGWRLAVGNTSRHLGRHAVPTLPRCSHVPTAEWWQRVGARLRRALLLRWAWRSHAPTLRPPFGERGYAI